MVRAYWLAVTKATPGEVYNIGSGSDITIRTLLDMLLGMSTADVRVEIDPERLRPSDVEVLLADASKFRNETGWEPQIPLETTMSDLLDHWRRRIAAAGPAPVA